MSNWTSVYGTITVAPMGRTQAEKRYILDTVLDHLPRVSGSESDMEVMILPNKNGSGTSCTHNEFGTYADFAENTSKLGTETYDEYILVVSGSLRDRELDQTYREFFKWIVRLAKRVMIQNVLVRISGYEKSILVQDSPDKMRFASLFEYPSWCNENREPAWYEYLMWNRAKDSDYPMLLANKYFRDEENDAEVKRRMEYYLS